MNYTRVFNELGKNDAAIAGGKGASLGEMTQAGIPVPPGFVVLAPTFDRFLTETDLVQEIDTILHSVKHDDVASVEHASEKIQGLILAAKMPADIETAILDEHAKLGAEFVAVRSSATAEDGAEHAWAGQLDTHLNTPREEVVRNVQRCWSSLFTPRAIFYRFEKGLHGTSISVAVVVQKMVQSELSGIAFSVHPVTEDHNQLIIEAGYGLGEAIVSGQVTPDSYVVEKNPRRIVDVNVSEQSKALYRKEGGGNEWRDLAAKGAEQVLSEARILELAELIIHIENHYGFPCDIEWAYEAGKFYITQSRPITTLSPAVSVADADFPDTLKIEYVKMGRWGMLPADVETWHTSETSEYFKELFGIWKESLAVNVFSSETYNRMFIPKRFVEALSARIDSITTNDTHGLERALLRFYPEKHHMRTEVPESAPKDVTALDTEALVAAYKANRQKVHRIVAYDQFGWIAEDYWTPKLAATLERYGLVPGTTEYHDTLFALIKPREISTTLEEKREVLAAVIAIKKGKTDLAHEAQRLATAFGWMPVLAYGTPWDHTWYEHELTDTLGMDDATLDREHDTLVRYTELRDSGFADACAKYHISDADAQVFVDYGLVIDTRNEAEYMNSLCGFHLLPLYAEIARRLSCTVDELRTLFEHEIVRALRGEIDVRMLIASKDAAAACAIVGAAERLEVTGDAARALATYAESHCIVAGAVEGDVARGVTASPGRARGRARIVPDPSHNSRVQQGDILITFATTVDYLPAMKKAAAIVTEVGGLTCHAAVVSREFGIPCVVSLKDAMTLFKDGDVVEVDADSGTVRIVGASAASVLEKEYMRDTTITIQESWGRALTRYLRETWGWENPYAPSVIHTFEHGSIAIWQDSRATQWIKDAVLKQESKEPGWLAERLRALDVQVKKLEIFWRKPYLETARELAQFVNAVDTMMNDYIPYYYASLDDRTPESAKSTILTYRDTDVIFSSASRLIRDTLLRLYPDRAPFETAILTSELLNPPPVSVLKMRQDRLTVVDGDTVLEESLNEYLSRTPDVSLASEEIGDATQIRGNTGFPGVVRGQVFVLYRRNQLPDVPKGVVLVSPMTTPDFLPAMERAVAFVTDEGGITCHAAIVAREMKKPCVIGTKVATQVLKDGDLVEVDAEAGVVRVLERADVSPKTLSKFFERERPLMYMMVWYDSDHDGLAHFTQQHVHNTLGIIPPKGKPGSVWYDPHELAGLEAEALSKINASPALRDEMLAHTRRQWDTLVPYLKDRRQVTSIDEFEQFYSDVCLFWHAMNTTYFRLPDHPELDAGFRDGIAAIRDETQEYSNHMAEYLVSSFEHLVPAYARFSHHIAPKEVRRFVEGPSPELVAELERRVREGAFILNGVVHPLSELDAVLAKHGLALETIDTNASEFTGAVGYRGSARGRVRVVMSVADIASVQEGEILVSVLTDPNYVPAMQKAAAFITDEGGVMSHAAIVAREMKKPCVIGTKVATQVLKDGDLVEVDAEKGIVHIIQRAQNDLAHELSPKRWDYVGLYKSPVFAAWFWCAWPQTDLVARAELPSAFYGYLAVRGGHACWTQDMKRALLAFTREKLAHDTGYFARMTQIAQEVFDEGIAFAKGISPDAPLLETFRELVRHRTRMQFFWAIGATMSYYFVDMLLAESAAESGIPESEIVSHLPKMQTPMLDIEQHARELRSQLAEAGIAGDIPVVAAAIRSSKELHASFDAFIREYDWIQETNWIGAPAELEDVLSLVCKEPHEETHATLHAETPRFTEVVAASGYIGFWRQAGCEYCSIFEMRVRPLLERIANKAGMSYRELLRCSPEEIMSTQKLVDLKAIAARRADDTSATVTRENGSVLVIDSDTSITSLSDALIPSADTNQKELRGEVGYKGRVRGTARIIIAREDFLRFQDGDVLVAPMTTPDYVILMQRASAIVTNMGGLLCHAAIVSRELKKPCVIGTKVATQVLKDGDMVEVDAERGVVTILERVGQVG